MDETLLSQLPDDLTVDIDGKNTPLREVPFVKEAKDWPTFAKTAYDAHREVGSRIPIKVDINKPEEVKKWRETHIPILRERGLLTKPPASPSEYNIKKPDDIPEGLIWDDKQAEEFAALLHKYEVPVELAGQLIEHNKKSMLRNVNFVKTTMEQGTQALKAEYGDKYEPMLEDVKRFTSKIFKTPDELALFTATGLANHPGFLSVMLRLSQVAKADSSFYQGKSGDGGSGSMTHDEVKAELTRIYTDEKHPDHAGYMRGDKAIMDKIDEMYKKAFPGDKTVSL